MENPIILSIVLAGKNDDYAGNFLQRIKFNIEKLSDNLSKLKKTNVEIIVVDWSSETRLSSDVGLSNLPHVKFLYVPQDVASQVSPDNGFSQVHSLNAGYRRSIGDYVFFIDGDSYINLKTTEKVIELCEKLKSDNKEAYYWASRYHLPYEIHSNSKTIEEIDNHIELWNNNGRKDWRREKILLNSVVAPMGLLLSRNIANHTTCYYEKLNKWGYIEIEFANRIKSKYQCDGDLDNDNDMYFFHLDHHSIGIQGKDKKHNIHMSANNFSANDESWGLNNYELELYTI